MSDIPADAHVLDSAGRISPAYSEFLRNAANAAGQALTAQSLATAAKTAATSATASANATSAKVTALLASPPVWVVGDYRPSSLPSVGPLWLLCDGSAVATADFPDLSAILLPITGPGASPGTFKLPGLQPIYDVASPAPGGPPVLQWFVRAK